MRKKMPREPRESAIASGWTVQAEPAAEIEESVRAGGETDGET